jgi:hypothetical protein
MKLADNFIALREETGIHDIFAVRTLPAAGCV